MKIVLHAGFHKTGTTTVQNALKTNRSTLAPEIHILLKNDLTGLIGATKGYSSSLAPLDLALISFETAQVAQTLRDHHAVIISAESLCGHIPGRDSIRDYAAAPEILRCITGAINQTLPQAELTVALTVRPASDWLLSCYTQHLRASRMRSTADEYLDEFADCANLDEMARLIADAVSPTPTLVYDALASRRHRLGLLDSLLDIVQYPATKRSALAPVADANIGPSPAQLAALLEVNRSAQSQKDVLAARQRLIKGTT